MESLRLAPLDTSARERPDALTCVLPPVSPPPPAAKQTSRLCSSAFDRTPPAALPAALTYTPPPPPAPPVAPPVSYAYPTPDAPPPAMSIHALTRAPNPQFHRAPPPPPVQPNSPAPPFVSGVDVSPVDRLSVKRPRKRTRRTATGIREVFACPYPNCDKVSSENSNLKAHMRLHTGEKPYVCNRAGCQKRFRWKSSLTYHEKALHTNQRPFVCSSCDKSFVEKRKLILHSDWCPAVRQQMQMMQLQQARDLQQQQQQIQQQLPHAQPQPHN